MKCGNTSHHPPSYEIMDAFPQRLFCMLLLHLLNPSAHTYLNVFELQAVSPESSFNLRRRLAARDLKVRTKCFNVQLTFEYLASDLMSAFHRTFCWARSIAILHAILMLTRSAAFIILPSSKHPPTLF